MALWGGRFTHGPADSVFALSRSVHFDWRLAPYDIVSSLAHLYVLEKSGLINKDQSLAIRNGLKSLYNDVEDGKFLPDEQDEDVHSALERGLSQRVGVIGGAIRAGRSRNDQVTTDLKLYLIDQMIDIALGVVELQRSLIGKASEYSDAVAPGFTHMQHAQPVLFGHELAKHCAAFNRDLSRIHDWLKRTSLSPLGSGALSGSSLPLDPVTTASQLGFAGIVENSIDGVSDRDYVAEALFIISLIGIHLSRIGEEWSLWSTTEFGWAQLDDAYSTGSSIMPQKKNPDVAELARGKAGRFIGNLTGLLTVLKGLPFAYNRDLQEDKETLFDSVENLLLLLKPVSGMVSTTTFNRDAMAKAAPLGFSLATEIADFLVRKGVPFAQAHEAAGACVKICEKNGKDLHQLTEAELRSAHDLLDLSVLEVLTVTGAIAGRITPNGTSTESVKTQIARSADMVTAHEKWITNERSKFSGMMSL
jgi:argininosuccinate lyase